MYTLATVSLLTGLKVSRYNIHKNVYQKEESNKHAVVNDSQQIFYNKKLLLFRLRLCQFLNQLLHYYNQLLLLKSFFVLSFTVLVSY